MLARLRAAARFSAEGGGAGGVTPAAESGWRGSWRSCERSGGTWMVLLWFPWATVPQTRTPGIRKDPGRLELVAGVGFEPTTFGL